MNELDFIMMVETEGFDETNPDHINGLQRMIDSELVWKLQGSWQRFASSLINAGVVSVGVRR